MIIKLHQGTAVADCTFIQCQTQFKALVKENETVLAVSTENVKQIPDTIAPNRNNSQELIKLQNAIEADAQILIEKGKPIFVFVDSTKHT